MLKTKKIIKISILTLIYFLISIFAFFSYLFIVSYYDCKKINVSAETNNNVYNIRYINDEFLHDKQLINIDDLNANTINAFVSIEDKDFFKHNGYNFKRILKASYNNLKSFSFKEGASTITQQLIKNKYLTSEKSISRKIKEIILSKKLEKTSTKKSILENYLNTIYFGHGCYGIQNASKFYFNKDASELSLSESCVLASIIKAPAYYSPINNYEKSQERKILVLSEMLKDKKINKSEYLEACQIQHKYDDKKNITYNSNNDYNLIEFIYSEAENILGISKEEIIKNNYKITTTLNNLYQKNLKTALFNNKNIIANEHGYKPDGLGIIINNENNNILAYYSNSEYNIYSSKRQPGSAIKPILVYAPAFEYGIVSPDTKILDEKIQIGNYSPQNLGGVNYGYVSVKDCVAKSLNIPAIKVMEKTGIERSKNFAKKLGIEFDKSDNNFAIALGGFTNGIMLKDLTNAYTAFANNGRYKKCSIINEISNDDGIVLYKNNKQKENVMSDASAYLTTSTLKYAVEKGTSKKLNNLDYDIAGKTGTVCVKNSNLNTDCFSIAYTSEITAGIWLGNYSYEKNKMLNGTNNGGTYATNILKDIFENIYTNKKPEDFKVPNSIINEHIDAYEYEYKNNIFKTNSSNYISMEFNKNYSPKYKKHQTINLDDILKINIKNNLVAINSNDIKDIEISLKNLSTNELINAKKHNSYFIFDNLNSGKYEIIVKKLNKNAENEYILNKNNIYIDKKLDD